MTSPSKIYVKAENGDVDYYSISFVATKSSNSKLTAIYLDGSLINGFDANITDYSYVMDVDAAVAPVLTYAKADVAQQVLFIAPAFEGVADGTSILLDIIPELHNPEEADKLELSEIEYNL